MKLSEEEMKWFSHKGLFRKMHNEANVKLRLVAQLTGGNQTRLLDGSDEEDVATLVSAGSE